MDALWDGTRKVGQGVPGGIGQVGWKQANSTGDGGARGAGALSPALGVRVWGAAEMLGGHMRAGRFANRTRGAVPEPFF